jgi:hypothetical protein
MRFLHTWPLGAITPMKFLGLFPLDGILRKAVPLDIAAEAGFFAALFCYVVLFALGDEPMRARMFGVRLLRPVSVPAGVKLLDDLVAGFLTVPSFGVILRSLLMSVAILHQSSFE